MENFERREKASDMELTQFLTKHIIEPCEDLHGNDARSIYIREAKRALDTMHDEDAKKMLKDIIQQYSD